MGRIWTRIAVAALALLPVPVLADGMFFPERVRPVPLSIPAQRAIVVFRNGVESLTVESTLDAKGQSFGWVIPVPAKPTAVERATRGPLDVLDRATEPDIVHETGFARGSPTWVFLFLAFLLLSRAALVRLGWKDRGFLAVFTLALPFLLLLAVPNLGSARLSKSIGFGPTAGTPSIPGVRAEPTRRVGAYEVTVLQADDAGSFARWLEASGFAALPAAGGPIVDAHVREGWSFVAVRLAREEEGRAAPHPLRIVFPAKEPVYPMRLTALAGGTTAVRLHVISDEGRTAPGLEVGVRDRLHVIPELSTQTGWARGTGLGLVLAHPRLVPDLWEGCVLTRLDGSFTPATMDRDIALRPSSSDPFRARYWSEKGARDTAAAYSLVPWVALSFVLLLVPPALLPLKGRSGNPFLPCLLVLSLAAGGAFLVIRASLPTIEVKVVRDYEPGDVSQVSVMSAFAPGMDLDKFVQDRVPRGDSPGQAEILERRGERVVRFYGVAGEPKDWTQPAATGEGR